MAIRKVLAGICLTVLCTIVSVGNPVTAADLCTDLGNESKVLSDDIFVEDSRLQVSNFRSENEEIISVENASNDYNNAVSINVNTAYKNTMEYDDTHYYKFVLSAPGEVSLTISHDLFSSYRTPWEVRLIDSNREYIDYFYSSDGYTQSKTGCSIGLPAGVYYVVVDFYESEAASYPYVIKVNYNQSDYWEKEVNDDWLTANPVTMNNWYYGASHTPQDSDYYTFTLNSPGPVTMHFRHQLYSGEAKGWSIDIYNQNKDIVYSMYSSDGYSESIQTLPTGLAAGVYYIHIRCNDGAPDFAHYYFNLVYSARDDYEQELNNNWNTANPVAVDKWYYGAFYDNHDYYKFSLNSTKVVTIEMQQNTYDRSTAGWDITVYNASATDSKTVYLPNGNVSSGAGESLRLGAGTYYLVANYTMSWPYDVPIYYAFKITTATEQQQQSVKTPPAVRLYTVKNQKKKKAYVEWYTSSDCSGYEAQIALNSGFSYGRKTKTVTSRSIDSVVFSKLKKKKKYYVRVRGYAKDSAGNKVYGAWSSMKTVKIKR